MSCEPFVGCLSCDFLMFGFPFLQAEEILRHEKHSWLLNHILYLEVQELVLDYELRSLEITLSSRDQQVRVKLRCEIFNIQMSMNVILFINF